MQETWVQSLGWEDSLEKEKAAHSSILAWRIPWTVWSMGSQRVGHNWATFTISYDTRDFLGGPVAKTSRSQYRGPRFNPWSGN